MVWNCLSKLIKSDTDKKALFEYFDNFKKILILFMNSSDLKLGIKEAL